MPFNNSSLNRLGSNLTDGGLRVSVDADVGKSLLIIGTAADGPVNIPVRLSDVGGIQNAVAVFGDASRGSLIHSAFEANGATQKAKDIRLMRISNGQKAFLNLKERDVAANLVTTESYYYNQNPVIQIPDVLVLTARYPGQIYNQVSIRAESGDGVDHPKSQYIVIYNPKTKVESWFSYDFTDFTADVDAHTVKELSAAINADSNLNASLIASVRDLQAEFTMKIADVRLGASSLRYGLGVEIDSNQYVSLVLSKRTPVYGLSGSVLSGIEDVTATGGAANVPTIGNLISRVNEIFELKEYKQDLKILGSKTAQLDFIPIKGNDSLGTETIIKYKDGSASEYATAQIVLKYRNLLIDTITDISDRTYLFSTVACPDDSPNQAYPYYTQSMVTANGLTARSNVDTSSVILYGTKNNITTVIPSGQYNLQYDAGLKQVTVEFVSGQVPVVGSALTIDYDSVIEDLSSEAASLTAALNSNDVHQYFVSGKQLTFGAALPADLSLRYRYKHIFEQGSDYVVGSSVGNKNDKIVFTNLTNQPQVSGHADTDPLYVGFDFIYDPEWIQVSTVQTLQGGTDGVNMAVEEKYSALKDALDSIVDYPVSYVVLTDMYFDDVKTVYDAETGLPSTVNAGFQTLLNTYLEKLTGSTSETIGIMSVKPAAGNTPTDVKSFVDKLTKVDSSDRNRAANILQSFGSKYMTIVAAEPVFSNEAAFIPYISTAEAVYAGLLSTIPVNTSPSNKRIGGILGLRYNLSGGPEGQLDKLTKQRIVTFRQNQVGDAVVVAGVTAASIGSDYAREMTRNIVFEVMSLIRLVAEPFLGEGNSLQTRAAMETAINASLQKLVELTPPALQQYDFKIRSSASDQVLGIVYIDLTLVPVGELREIRVTVSLRASL